MKFRLTKASHCAALYLRGRRSGWHVQYGSLGGRFSTKAHCSELYTLDFTMQIRLRLRELQAAAAEGFLQQKVTRQAKSMLESCALFC